VHRPEHRPDQPDFDPSAYAAHTRAHRRAPQAPGPTVHPVHNESANSKHQPPRPPSLPAPRPRVQLTSHLPVVILPPFTLLNRTLSGHRPSQTHLSMPTQPLQSPRHACPRCPARGHAALLHARPGASSAGPQHRRRHPWAEGTPPGVWASKDGPTRPLTTRNIQLPTRLNRGHQLTHSVHTLKALAVVRTSGSTLRQHAERRRAHRSTLRIKV
jgi:hypothetical protein